MLDLDYILLNSCYNHLEEGWNEYTIETHCILYKIIAKLNEDGKTYTIKSYTAEDC